MTAAPESAVASTEVNASLPRPRLHRPGLLLELLSTLMFIVAVYALAEMAIPRSNLEGPSMQPNLHAGQYLIISRLDYLFGDPQRGDVAVFQAPDKDASEPRLIKRVIGLPGETVTVRGDDVLIDGQVLDQPFFILRPCTSNCQEQSWTLGPDEYIMLGDNRSNSRDSRSFGPVNRSSIVGRAVFRYLPVSEIGVIDTFR
jgi:signal peptidase I